MATQAVVADPARGRDLLARRTVCDCPGVLGRALDVPAVKHRSMNDGAVGRHKWNVVVGTRSPQFFESRSAIDVSKKQAVIQVEQPIFGILPKCPLVLPGSVFIAFGETGGTLD